MTKKDKIVKFISLVMPNVLFLFTLTIVVISKRIGSQIAPSILVVFGVDFIPLIITLLIPGMAALYSIGIGLGAAAGIFALPALLVNGTFSSLGLSSVFGWALWCTCFFVLIAVIYAFKFELGSFQADSTYVSGKHYEITIENGTGKIEEKNEYSGGGEWIGNCYLFLLRIFAILICGTLFFISDLLEYIEKEHQEKIRNQIFKILLTISIIMLVGGLSMYLFPLLVFRFIHFSIFIFLYILISIIMLVAALKFTKKVKRLSLILTIFAFLGIMIFACAAGNIDLNISNVAELEAIANIPNAGNRNYTLTNDIDYNGETSNFFGSIDEFNGVFDGNHFSIRNINVQSKSKYVQGSCYIGFVEINDGEIKNTRFDNIEIDMTLSYDKHYVGIVAARNNSGVISNCIVSNCKITGNKIDNHSYSAYFGGVVGYDDGLGGKIHNVAFINNSDNIVFDTNGSGCIGGIIGRSYLDKIDCEMKDIYVYKNNKEIDSKFAYIGSVETYPLYSMGKYYLTNCVNCFSNEGNYDNKRLIETNVYNFSNPINRKNELPLELSHWTYSTEFECYIPCNNFVSKE